MAQCKACARASDGRECVAAVAGLPDGVSRMRQPDTVAPLGSLGDGRSG